MPRVIHFEILADDPERALEFYGNVFGWTFRKWDGPMEYWFVNTGPEDQPGIDGGLQKREEVRPGDSLMAFVCTVDVDSIDDYVAKVEAAGGSIIRGKGPIPGIGWFAYCKDTEGNHFGMMQLDPDAA